MFSYMLVEDIKDNPKLYNNILKNSQQKLPIISLQWLNMYWQKTDNEPNRDNIKGSLLGR